MIDSYCIKYQRCQIQKILSKLRFLPINFILLGLALNYEQIMSTLSITYKTPTIGMRLKHLLQNGMTLLSILENLRKSLPPKRQILTVRLKNCKKSTIKHSIGKAISFNFKNLSTIFFPKL